jgi:predicted RND superfamily exporter protein
MRSVKIVMRKFFRHPALILGAIALITVFFALQLPRVELDNNNMRFLPEKNQARIISEHIDETFGGSVIILIGLERPYGTVLEPALLARIREYSEAVKNIDFAGDVNSIMSTQFISAQGDAIVVADLVDGEFSGAGEEIAELRRRVASWDVFRGAIISDDLSAAQIIVSLDVSAGESTRPEVTASVIRIRDMAREMFDGLAEVYITGQPIINNAINESMITDNLILIPLVIVVVLLVLFFSFRRLTFVILPLLTVITAVVWMVGAMALFGIKLSILSTLLPVLLIAVGSAYGIHVVTHYLEDTRARALTAEEHQELIYTLVGKLVKPVFLAALTTFAGFVSFCFTSIVPMREFGLFTSLGVLAAFAAAVTLIPSLLLVRGPRPVKQRGKHPGEPDRINAAIAGFFIAVAKKRKLVLAAAALVTGISLYGLSKIVVDNNLVEFFRNETDISRSDRFIREYFGGSKELTLVVEADTSDDLLAPEVLSAVDGLSAYLAGRVPVTGKVLGFTDIIKRINQVFNADESPEGLRSAGPESEPADDAFGFGDAGDDAAEGFGFSGFGFDEYAVSGTEDAPAPEVYDMGRYSAADILSLLDTAAGKSANLSGSDLVRELKRLTNYEGMAYYEIPADPARYGKKTSEELRQLVSNYLVLLAGDDNSGYSNDPFEPTALKTTIQLKTTGNQEAFEVVDIIHAYVEANFPKTVRVTIGGWAVLEGEVTNLIVNSQIISVALSVLIVFIIVALSNRSLASGLIAAAPIAIAVLCNFAVMGFFGIKLNIGTAIIASLAVGIGIDYTIHFMDFFRREYQRDHHDGWDFLRRTFVSSGKAIIINAVSVGAGFGVLAFSQFRILAELGALIALSMMITALVSLTVVPALLITVKPKFIYGER